MTDTLQLFVPTFDVEQCLDQIRDCLECGWTGMGYKTEEFEHAFAEYTLLPPGVFVSSGSAAIQLALEVLGEEYRWDRDDEVITSPITFVSANHAILHAGFSPVFADVADNLNLDPASVESRITDKTRAVLFVGIGGNHAYLAEMLDLCAKHRLRLIVDAAHMCGSWTPDDFHAGAGADAVAFSFQAVKTLPTGDAGLVTFPVNERLAAEARRRAWCGIDRDTWKRTQAEGTYRWEYNVTHVGYKFNGNAIMAAIALAQLTRLDHDNAYRRFLAEAYTQRLDGRGVRVIKHARLSARHLFQVDIEPCGEEFGISAAGCNRDAVMAYLNSLNIGCGVHYKDNTLYPMYQYATPCPNARSFSRRILSLPLHLRMTTRDVDRVSQALLDAVRR